MNRILIAIVAAFALVSTAHAASKDNTVYLDPVLDRKSVV